MKCIDEQQLWEYIDGEVAEQKRTTLETHFDRCPECQKELELLLTLDEEFTNAITAQPSMRFTKNVMELIEVELNVAEYQPLMRKFWRRFVAFSFASMVLTLMVVAIFFPSTGTVPFETEIQTVSMGISWLLSFTQNPILFNSIIIVLAFWLLYGFDKYLAASQLVK